MPILEESLGPRGPVARQFASNDAWLRKDWQRPRRRKLRLVVGNLFIRLRWKLKPSSRPKPVQVTWEIPLVQAPPSTSEVSGIDWQFVNPLGIGEQTQATVTMVDCNSPSHRGARLAALDTHIMLHEENKSLELKNCVVCKGGVPGPAAQRSSVSVDDLYKSERRMTEEAVGRAPVLREPDA